MGDAADTLDGYIDRLFTQPDMLRMGHGQRREDNNLGLGWIYYALGRVLQPQTSVVIGSYRGFVPSVIGRALIDNGEAGTVHFVDPSLVDAFWSDAEVVQQHFARLGTPNVHHHHHTTQSFVLTAHYAALDNIGLLMIDGLHTASQACYDYLAFLPKLASNAVVMFHDSTERRLSTFYGAEKAYQHSVCDLIEALRADAALEVFNLPIGSGVCLVRGQPSDTAALATTFPMPS